MRLADRAWYPLAAGGVLLAFWLLAVLMPGDFPTWGQALLIGGVTGATTVWTEGLRRDRRLRGQDEKDMGFDYRA